MYGADLWLLVSLISMMTHVESTNAFAVRVPVFEPKVNEKLDVIVALAASDGINLLTLPVSPQIAEVLRSNHTSSRKLLASVLPPFLMVTVSVAGVPGSPVAG